MKRSRFSETQIVGILKGADAGIAVKEVCPKYGIAEGNDVTTVWGMVQGLTAYARSSPYTSWRVNLERRAGQFREATSLRIAISNAQSAATSFFSQPFPAPLH